MEFNNSKIDKAIRKELIKPLNDGCKYNMNKLIHEPKTKHKETINLLCQAYSTLDNTYHNLKSLNLVDCCTLLRSAYEYIMMGMVIQFYDDVYNEFVDLTITSSTRNKTRVRNIINRFRSCLNDICSVLFKDLSQKGKDKLLTELYDKLCYFTHSSLVVSTLMEIKNSHEKECFGLVIFQNYLFLKILLFACLKYFTNDQEHYLYIDNIGFSYAFLFIKIESFVKQYKLNFDKYKELLYYNKNIEYFEKNKTDIIGQIKLLFSEIQNLDDDKIKDLDEKLKAFLA